MANVERALAVCRKYPSGATQQNFQDELGFSQQQVLDLVNGLLHNNHLEALMRADQTIVFKERDAAQAIKLKGLHPEDHLVLQAIKKSGAQGIWTKDMKRETNLPAAQISKILKTLEVRNLVKPVQSVNDGKRKIYVLYDIEPAQELTGGVWFTGADMDMEFINVMQQHCKTLIKRLGKATVPDLLERLQNGKVANVPLDLASVQTLVKSLAAAREVEQDLMDGTAWRIAKQQIPESAAFKTFPCGICPVIDQCMPGGKISPQTCVYFDSYLTW